MTHDGQRREQILRHPPPCHCELCCFKSPAGRCVPRPAPLEPITRTMSENRRRLRSNLGHLRRRWARADEVIVGK
jgi:hypothetical protein